MKIKVCGMCDPRNIRAVAELDIDMMGFIFSPSSPRFVGESPALAHFLTSEPALSVKNGAPKRVGVFVNSRTADIAWIVDKYGLDYVQLHGNEDRAFVMRLNDTLADTDKYNIEIIKALSINDENDVKRWRDYKDVVDMFLFDTKGTVPGGTGMHFDWDVLKVYDGDIPFLLSGGIGPNDVQRVLSFHHKRMVGIDVNSRFEMSSRIKSIDKLAYFVNEIRAKEYAQTNE